RRVRHPLRTSMSTVRRSKGQRTGEQHQQAEKGGPRLRHLARDATQTDIYAPLRAAQGIARVTHATVRAHAGDLWWLRRGPLPKEKILDGRRSNEDQGAVGHDTACRHQPSATALHHGHHVHLRFASVSRRCRLTSSAHPWRLMPMNTHAGEVGYRALHSPCRRLDNDASDPHGFGQSAMIARSASIACAWNDSARSDSTWRKASIAHIATGCPGP